jgi:hypothetical protein
MFRSAQAATLGVGLMRIRQETIARWLTPILVCLLATACATGRPQELVGRSESAGPTYHLGGGAGIIAAHDSGSRFGEVYGTALPAFIFDFETRFPSNWFLKATGEYGSTSGREVLITGDESETKLSLFPAHFSIGKLFDLTPEWQVGAGGGATISTYREVNDIVESEGTRAGGHGLVDVRWHRNRWSLNGTLRYTYVPDGIEERLGGQEVMGRYDLGYLSLAFTVQYQIWPHGTGGARARSGAAEPLRQPGATGQSGEVGRARGAGQAGQTADWMSERGRFQVQIYGAGVIPTDDYHRPSTRVRDLYADVDASIGIGAGFHARLTGPLGVGFDAIFAWPGIHGTLDYPYADTTFYADGELDQRMFALGLDLHLLEHQVVDLYVAPLVSYISYDGRLTGEYTNTVDSAGYAFGLGVGADIGRGRWVFHTSFKHLSLARISGFDRGFDVRPVLFTFGLGFRF